MPGQQGERQREHPAEERDGPPTRNGVARMDRVDPSDGPQPPADGDRDAQRRQRLERPAEQERTGRRGLGGTGPWAATGPARAPAPTIAMPIETAHRITRQPAIGGMVARTGRAVVTFIRPARRCARPTLAG